MRSARNCRAKSEGWSGGRDGELIDMTISFSRKRV